MTEALIEREQLLSLFEEQGSPETRQLVERALVEGGMAEQTHFAKSDVPKVLELVVTLSSREMLVRATANPDPRDGHALAMLNAVEQHALPLLRGELTSGA